MLLFRALQAFLQRVRMTQTFLHKGSITALFTFKLFSLQCAFTSFCNSSWFVHLKHSRRVLEHDPATDVCPAPATHCLMIHVVSQVGNYTLPSSAVKFAELMPSNSRQTHSKSTWFKASKCCYWELIHSPSLEVICRQTLAPDFSEFSQVC